MVTHFQGHLLSGDHASRPLATDVNAGALYSCSTHSIVYQSDGATWSNWAVITGGGGGVTAHSALTGLTSGDDHTQYALDADVTAAIAAHAAAADPHTGYQQESEKGAANGYAALDSGTLVPVAQLGTGTPTGSKFLRDDRVFATPAGASPYASLEFEFGPAAAANDYRILRIPFDFTPTGWAILGDVSGTATFSLWLDTWANGQPTVADVAHGSAQPSVSGAIQIESTTLTGWTTPWLKGKALKVVLSTLTTMTQVTLSVDGTR